MWWCSCPSSITHPVAAHCSFLLLLTWFTTHTEIILVISPSVMPFDTLTLSPLHTLQLTELLCAEPLFCQCGQWCRWVLWQIFPHLLLSNIWYHFNTNNDRKIHSSNLFSIFHLKGLLWSHCKHFHLCLTKTQCVCVLEGYKHAECIFFC